MPATVNEFPVNSSLDREIDSEKTAGPAATAVEGSPEAPDDGGADASANGKPEKHDPHSGARPGDAELLRLATAADKQAITFAERQWRTTWSKNYKSFRSEYIDSSKYKSADYRHRSKIFRPKTRIAVTKNLAAAAQSLFANVEMVSAQAGDETDQSQVANAELIGALMNYRLDRTSGKNSIPWFLTSMGARQDCDITGICVSKQYWSYAERKKTKVVLSKDPATGKTVESTVEEMVKIKDKPEIELIPGENAGLDPAAHWTDPVNSGAYFYCRYPMHVQDVRNMTADPRTNWREVTDQTIFAKAKVQEFQTAQVRRAREGGVDPKNNQESTVSEFDVVWVVEWFIRTKDEDWCFWTLGTNFILSDAVPTEEAYPWKGGERPYRVGLGNLEAHRIVPQSSVETLGPLQQEINDVTNLRLDNLKQVIQPVALVKRGKKIDVDGLKRRYPVLYVENPKEDVQWDRPPDSAASSFAETSRLDTDFDDLAGNFNGGSVSSNRQVGETVGGMKLMANAAGAVSEFYVRLWVETWLEPVLADLAKLEAYYESDEKILALAKKRAPQMIHFGESELTDEFLMQEVVVRVSAGIGSPDPMQRLGKINQAMTMTTTMFQGSKAFQTGALRMNEEALINEIWGDAGIRDAFKRFFVVGEPTPAPGAEGQAPQPAVDPAELQDRAAERGSKEKIAKLKVQGDLAKTLIGHKAGQVGQHRDHKHEGKKVFLDTLMKAMSEHAGAKAAQRQAQMQPRPAPSPAQPPAF